MRAGAPPRSRLTALVLGSAMLAALTASVTRLAPPEQLLGTLATAGRPLADPATTIMAAVTLLAEAVAAYLLLVGGLTVLAGLPGSAGWLADRISRRVAAPGLRRWIGSVVAGLLLANTSMAATPALAATGRVGQPAAVATLPAERAAGSAIARLEGLAPPFGAAVSSSPHGRWQPARSSRPSPATRSATHPEGPARGVAVTPPRSPRDLPEDGSDPVPDIPGAGWYVVRPGDALWTIAARRLPAVDRSAARVERLWRQIYAANRAVVGPDPSLILPGTRLRIPAVAVGVTPRIRGTPSSH